MKEKIELNQADIIVKDFTEVTIEMMQSLLLKN